MSHGQPVHQTIRRFVIVARDKGHHSQCLSVAILFQVDRELKHSYRQILTYSGQGTTKPGLKNARSHGKVTDHAIIYTGDTPPDPLDGETLALEPIQLIPNTERDKLAIESRINYAKIYTVEHNVKVLFVGKIAPSSQRRLVEDFDYIWNQKDHIGVK